MNLIGRFNFAEGNDHRYEFNQTKNSSFNNHKFKTDHYNDNNNDILQNYDHF